MMTRAAVLHETHPPKPYANSRPLKIQSLRLDEPGNGEILIRVRATGLCHSDLSVINGTRLRELPIALGHEAAGEVVEVGPNVTRFRRGDHVICAFVPSCGKCLPCQEGRPALCEAGAAANTAGTLLSGERRLTLDDKPVNHHLGVSGFAEYAVVSESSLIKVDAEVPFQEVALFGCAIMTGVGAVINTARIPAGCSVAIVGLGGVGMSALLGAILAGAGKVIAVDINPNKLALAAELGATYIVDARDPSAVSMIRSDTQGGVDYGFETAGSIAAMQLAFDVTRRGGTTVSSGLPHPESLFSFPLVRLAAEERTIKGSYIGSCVPSRDVPRLIRLYKQGRLPVNRLLSGTLPLDDINEGFDKLDNGEVFRLVVCP